MKFLQESLFLSVNYHAFEIFLKFKWITGLILSPLDLLHLLIVNGPLLGLVQPQLLHERFLLQTEHAKLIRRAANVPQFWRVRRGSVVVLRILQGG